MKRLVNAVKRFIWDYVEYKSNYVKKHPAMWY